MALVAVGDLAVLFMSRVHSCIIINKMFCPSSSQYVTLSSCLSFFAVIWFSVFIEQLIDCELLKTYFAQCC
jgi:hypothetical protein